MKNLDLIKNENLSDVLYNTLRNKKFLRHHYYFTKQRKKFTKVIKM